MRILSGLCCEPHVEGIDVDQCWALLRHYAVSGEERCHCASVPNFAKCWPISTIFHWETQRWITMVKLGTERVQVLAEISRSAVCYHSNEIRAPIANPLNNAQLGAPLPLPKLHPGPCSSVRTQRWRDRQTDRQTDTQTHVNTIYLMPSTTYAKCNDSYKSRLSLSVSWNAYAQKSPWSENELSKTQPFETVATIFVQWR